MKKITMVVVIIVSFLGLYFIPVQAESSLRKVRDYFTGKKRVTMTGVIAISGENRIYFKDESGKLYRLKGKQSKNFENRKGDTVEITGYVKKHNLEVRRYKIIKEYVEPEPEPEVDNTETDITSDDSDNSISSDDKDSSLELDDSDVSSDDSETYTVVSGDTLGKISKKFYGTTAKWKKIAEDTDISNPKRLKVGQILTINK